MGFTLASTTESQQELQRVASLDSDWKTAPVKPEDLPGPGDIPANIPQRLYNELRDLEIREKKEAGPGLLQDDDRDTGKSERRKEIEAAIRKAQQSEARRIAAESRVTELRAKLGSDTGETEAPATPSESNGQKTYLPGAEKYPDFAEAMADADRAQLTVPDRAATAIKAVRNRADVVYYLARNPEVCRELWDNPDSATQLIGELSKQLEERPPEVKPARQPQAQPLDGDTLQLMQKYHNHTERVRSLLAARPDADQLISAVQSSGIGISPTVEVALVEQDNSEKVVLHLLERPELRAELNRLSYPTAMARVSRIAAQLASKAAAKRERAKPPSPITPVGASSSRTGLSLDDPSIPIGTFIRERNRQEWQRKRAGR